MRLAFRFAIALWLSFPAAGLASQQPDPASSPKAPAQAPAAPAPKENAPDESAQKPPTEKTPEKTTPAETAPAETDPTKTAPGEQVPAEIAPAAPANPPTPAAEKKEPEGEVKQEMDAGSAVEPSPPGTSPSGTSSKRTRKRPKRSAPAPNGAPRKIVVREGGATEPAEQIVPGMTPMETAHQRQNAEQWLASTGDQLKQLAERTLDARQQDTVAQIHNYMDGARKALQEGDVRRASTLAQKAHLLAEDLVKH
jgi:hypothetical protein